MSVFQFGIQTIKPTRKQAKIMHKVCIDEGGYGYNEVNVKPNQRPEINHGQYQGWFSGPNLGNPFDRDLAQRVSETLNCEESY